jgi:hypothetical protein
LLLFSSVGVIMLVEISPRAAESHTGNFAEPTSKKWGIFSKLQQKALFSARSESTIKIFLDNPVKNLIKHPRIRGLYQ